MFDAALTSSPEPYSTETSLGFWIQYLERVKPSVLPDKTSTLYKKVSAHLEAVRKREEAV
jgi:hypothetical protein